MTSGTSQESSIRFGQFELAPRTGQLCKDGVQVKLQNQPFKVLAFLAAHSGELVTREELRQQVWRGDTFVDFEHGLNFCIKQIRGALGDNAQAPLYIETLPRRGYRFIAPVQVLNNTKSNGPATVTEQVEPTFSHSTDRPSAPSAEVAARLPFSLAKIGVLLAAALLVAAAYFLWGRLRPTAPANAKIMLAVLPVDNLSANPEQEFFSDGLTEEMIMQLGSLQPQRLGVIARTSIMKYKQSNKDVSQIGRELGVDYVLEGSVRREGDRLRIVSQLIRVADQTHLWAESYEAGADDILSVQKTVAGRIARALSIELLPRQADAGPAVAQNPEAHEYYLKGRYAWNKGDAADLRKSVEYFRQAIEQDASYAPAYAGIAQAFGLLPMVGDAEPRDSFPDSKAAALRSIELDPRLADGHSALGSVKLWFEWDWPEAEKEFRRAIELNPSYGRAHHDYAWLLVATGRPEEAVAQIKQALELDPLSPLANSDVGWVYLFARRYDEAIDQIKRTLELEPGFRPARTCLEMAYVYKGMLKEALELARQKMARDGATPQELAAVDSVTPAEGLNIIRRRSLAKHTDPSPYATAQIYAALSQNEAALQALGKAFEARAPLLVFLRADPAWDGLRRDSRFQDLVRRVGLPAQ
jgi:TolB-like protein/DNA-binding winged helix-turn-helix (wHTH) protein